MTRYRRQWQALGEAPPPFILMHHLRGVGENLRDHFAPRTRWAIGACEVGI